MRPVRLRSPFASRGRLGARRAALLLCFVCMRVCSANILARIPPTRSKRLDSTRLDSDRGRPQIEPPEIVEDITVTSGDSPSEVHWSLVCALLKDPIAGGAPYVSVQDASVPSQHWIWGVPSGNCTLTMSDAYCDGWSGAEWSAPGLTDESYSIDRSAASADLVADLGKRVGLEKDELLCTKQVSFRIAESPPEPPLPPLLLPAPPPPLPPQSPLPPLPPPLPPPQSPHWVSISVSVSDRSRADTGSTEAQSQWVPWALLPLCILLASLVLFYRLYSRISRDRANLRLSRDRANFDLQLLTHQHQIPPRGHVQGDDLLSLPDSLPDSLPNRRCASLASGAAASLPPGPPSDPVASVAGSVAGAAAASLPPGPSSASQLAVAQNVGGEVPLSWAEADRQFYASAAGKAYLAAATGGASESSGPSRPSGLSAPSESSPTPPVPSPAPRPKKKRARRREEGGTTASSWLTQLAQRWQALSTSEKAKYMQGGAQAGTPQPLLIPFPSAALTVDPIELAHSEATRLSGQPHAENAPPAPAPAIEHSLRPPTSWVARVEAERHRNPAAMLRHGKSSCNPAASAAPSTSVAEGSELSASSCE